MSPVVGVTDANLDLPGCLQVPVLQPLPQDHLLDVLILDEMKQEALRIRRYLLTLGKSCKSSAHRRTKVNHAIALIALDAPLGFLALQA